jgi:plastocyanin
VSAITTQKKSKEMLRCAIVLSLLLASVLCATVTVTSSSVSFSPASISISVGDTVTWTSLTSHNVAQVASNTATTFQAGGFRSGEVSAVTSYSKVFDAATIGNKTVLYYICEPHVSAGMRGQINIVAKSDSSTLSYSISLIACIIFALFL